MFNFLRKSPNPSFAQELFALLLVVFIVIGYSSPAVGLTGLGVTLIIAASLVEANHDLIWEHYKRSYKQQVGWAKLLSEPKDVYNTLNVYVIWPIIFLLGVAAVIAAVTLS